MEFRKDQILENEEKKRTCGGKQPLFLTLTGCLSILLIFALCAALLPEPSSLLAVNPTVEMTDEDRAAIQKKMDELNDLSKSIDDYEKRMKANSSQQKSVIGQLKNLQSNMNGIENDLASLKKDLAATEANIGGLEKDIEVKTGEVNQRSDYLNERLCQIYTEGDASYLDVLFASTSLTDFLTRYDLMGKIVENDMSMLAGLQADRQQLETEKASLEAAKAKLDRIKAQQEEKHQTLESQSTEKAGLLKTLESDKAEINKALDELEEAQKEIEKFVAGIQAKYKSVYMGSGAMGWPVPGRTSISSGYGYRIHPITKKRSFHTGIDIPAPKNTPVRASEKGKVIYAANNGAYGNTVILDHGGGISSQYSHLNTIGVSIGQIVLKGDTVGGVGTTGWSTGNHLHFTIMKDGKTVAPLGYVQPS